MPRIGYNLGHHLQRSQGRTVLSFPSRYEPLRRDPASMHLRIIVFTSALPCHHSTPPQRNVADRGCQRQEEGGLVRSTLRCPNVDDLAHSWAYMLPVRCFEVYAYSRSCFFLLRLKIHSFPSRDAAKSLTSSWS